MIPYGIKATNNYALSGGIVMALIVLGIFLLPWVLLLLGLVVLSKEMPPENKVDDTAEEAV